jgi:hypothetical protein
MADPCRGEVWLADLGTGRGRERAGRDDYGAIFPGVVAPYFFSRKSVPNIVLWERQPSWAPLFLPEPPGPGH